MQDPDSHNKNTKDSVSELELLRKERKQLMKKLRRYEAKYHKLAAIVASRSKKWETHIFPSGTPWLPFDFKEDLNQAHQEPEAEVLKLLENRDAYSKRKSKKA